MDKQIECFCGGKAFLKTRNLRLKENSMTIKDTHYYKCRKCGDNFSTSEQMHELDAKIRVLRKEMAKAHA